MKRIKIQKKVSPVEVKDVAEKVILEEPSEIVLDKIGSINIDYEPAITADIEIEVEYDPDKELLFKNFDSVITIKKD